MSHDVSHLSSSAQAFGKAIITGEHVVLYGGRAIAIPLSSLKTTIEISNLQKSQKTELNFELSPLVTNSISIPKDKALALLRTLFQDAFHILNISTPYIDIKIDSNIPVGAGLGSSASLCVAALKSLSKFFEIQLTPSVLAEKANILEAHFHGTPSGLDTSVVSYEKAICFQKGSAPEILSLSPLSEVSDIPLNTSHFWPFVLVDSCERSTTKDMIGIARSHFTGPQNHILINSFNTLYHLAQKSLHHFEPQVLGKVMTDTWGLLRKINVSTPSLDRIADQLIKLGALGAKPTGAGGGGFILALLDYKNLKSQTSEIKKLWRPDQVHLVFLKR